MKAQFLAAIVVLTPLARSPGQASATAFQAGAHAVPGVAPPSPPALKSPGPQGQTAGGAGTMAGAWRLAQIGGKVDCTLMLTERVDHATAGRDIAAPIACQRAFPPLKALTSWTVGGHGAPVFTGPKVKPVTFTGPPGGPYSATGPDGKAWRLTAAPDKPVAATAH